MEIIHPISPTISLIIYASPEFDGSPIFTFLAASRIKTTMKAQQADVEIDINQFIDRRGRADSGIMRNATNCD
jgi:hypothetical protein